MLISLVVTTYSVNEVEIGNFITILKVMLLKNNLLKNLKGDFIKKGDLIKKLLSKGSVIVDYKQTCINLLSAIFLYFTKRKYFKNYEKCLLFHLKSSFSFLIFCIFSLPSHIFQIQRAR